MTYHRAHPAATHRRGPHAQSGVGVFVVLAMLITLTFVGLSLDAGRLWLERRTVQRTADLAAMAAATYTGCGSWADQSLSAAKATAEQNGLDPALVVVQTGKVLPSGATKGAYAFTAADSQLSNGAQVTVSKVVPVTILNGGLFTNKTVTMTATATAEGGPPVGTYSVGSVYGVSAEAASQISNLYKGILGSNSPTLNTTDINNLIKSTVTLEQLRVADGSASINDLLNKQMTFREFLDLLAKASPDAASQKAFQDLYAATLNNGLKFTVGQILNIQSPPASAVSGAQISVFDLINAGFSAGTINGNKGIIKMNLGLNFIGTTTLTMLSPPIIAIGPAGKDLNGNWCSKAQSAQLSLQSTFAPLKFTDKNGNTILDLSIIDFALRVDLLSTTGHMDSLSVVPGAIVGTLSSQATALTLVLTNSNDVNKDISSSANFGIAYIGPKLLNTGFKIYLPIGQSTTKSKDFKYTSKADLPAQELLGAGSVGDTLGGLLGTDTYIEARLVGLKVKITALGDILGLITAPLGKALDGLLAAFGIQTGSIHMQVMDVQVSPPILRQ